MFPKSVECEDCGQKATVRGYGRIEYRWPESNNTGLETSAPTIDCIRLAIDCPSCGVKSQEFFPDESSPAAQRSRISARHINPFDRRRTVSFRRAAH